MERITENKIIIVKRKTRLEELVTKFNTIEQAKFYVESLGSDFTEYLNEDKIYTNSINQAYKTLSELGRVQILNREYISNFIFGEKDLVVAVGQDGLVANTLKYLSNQLLIGVNPDPMRWDGVLLPFKVGDLSLIVKDVFKGRRKTKDVTMAQATLNDGQIMYAVNDLFIGQKTHVSSRYKLEFKDKEEQQSSSGIIISTGLGYSGWMKSIITGASNIANSINKNNNIIDVGKKDWSSEELIFSVREPFPSKMSQTEITYGKITLSNELKIISQMPENGVIFSDGIETDFLEFNSGIKATISIADKKGFLIV